MAFKCILCWTGYFNRKKVKLNEDGSIDLNGMHISKNLIHVSEFESFFSGVETAQKFKDKENDLYYLLKWLNFYRKKIQRSC